MDKNQIEEVIGLLQKNEKQSSYAVFNGIPNTPVTFSEKNFHTIPKAGTGKVAFIDGGNAEILKSSSFSVQLIRVYCTIYENLVRVKHSKKEFFVVVTPSMEGSRQFFNVSCVGADFDFESFDANDESLRQGTHTVDISGIGGVVRRFSELMTAKEIADELSSEDLIVIDGDLVGAITGENKYISKLCSSNVMICGLSKTCSMITNTGENAIHAIRKISPLGAWYYHPLFNLEGLSIGFGKLHPKSKYIFRIDTFDDVEEVCQKLLGVSTDPIFLGYPYGLIEADRFARVSNKEKEYYKIKFMVSAGERWKEISALLKSNDAHSILDTVL